MKVFVPGWMLTNHMRTLSSQKKSCQEATKGIDMKATLEVFPRGSSPQVVMMELDEDYEEPEIRTKNYYILNQGNLKFIMNLMGCLRISLPISFYIVAAKLTWQNPSQVLYFWGLMTPIFMWNILSLVCYWEQHMV